MYFYKFVSTSSQKNSMSNQMVATRNLKESVPGKSVLGGYEITDQTATSYVVEAVFLLE